MDRNFLRYINSKTWDIDPVWGFSQLFEYMSKIQSIKEGIMTKAEAFIEKQSSGIIEIESDEGRTQLNLEDYNFSDLPSGSIARLSYSGVMRNEDGLCSYGINSYTKALRSMYKSSNVSAIVFNMNSGGGESASGHNLNAAIKERNKPVIVHSEFMGSAAVMGTASADEIIGLHNAAEFGSIGSYISLNKEILEDYKEAMLDFYAEQTPDKNKAFRKALEGDFSGLVAKANQSAKIFISELKRSRNINEDYEDTLKGGMFLAREARKRGLIDRIGGEDLVKSRIKAQLKYYN